MREIKSKIKRIKPIIKIRKNSVDKNIFELFKIKKAKDDAQKTLHKLQEQYLQQVQQLNEERQSSDRKNLYIMEQNVDYLKQEWIKALYVLKNLEKKEQEQLQLVLQSKKDLNIIEKLNEKYNIQLQKEQTQEEQKTIDQVAIRQFINNTFVK